MVLILEMFVERCRHMSIPPNCGDNDDFKIQRRKPHTLANTHTADLLIPGWGNAGGRASLLLPVSRPHRSALRIDQHRRHTYNAAATGLRGRGEHRIRVQGKPGLMRVRRIHPIVLQGHHHPFLQE